MTSSLPKFQCSLSLHAGHDYLEESRLRLLEEIRNQGTLLAAAKSLKISYKTAWSWLDTMGNAASGPLVESVQGGAHGGTTHLSPLGEELLSQYKLLRKQHQHFMTHLPDTPSGPEEVDLFLRRLSLQTSARNQLHGNIIRIWGDSAQAWVDVLVDQELMITARVARTTIQEMGLEEGCEIATLSKATCTLITLPDQKPDCSRRSPMNRIKGRLARSIVDEDYAQVTLETRTHRTLTALVPVSDWETMQAQIDAELYAWFDPNHVILARLN